MHRCSYIPIDHATLNWLQIDSHSKISSQAKLNLADQLPVEVMNLIISIILKRRKFLYKCRMYSCRVIDAFNFARAYPYSMPHFASYCDSVAMYDICMADDCTVGSCFAPYFQHLTVCHHAKLNLILGKMCQAAPTLRSISIAFSIEQCKHDIDSILQNLSRLMQLSVETLRELSLQIYSRIDNEDFISALIQQGLAPFVSSVRKISISGCFALNKHGLLTLLANAGSSLRHLSLCGLQPNRNQFEEFSNMRHAFPGITELGITEFDDELWDDIEEFIFSFGPALRAICFLNDNEDKWAIDSAAIISERTQLQSIETFFYAGNFERVILPLAQVSETLRCISLETPDPVSANDFKRIGGLFPHLREFLWETDADQTDAFCELCKQIGNQLHVLKYTGSATDTVLRATAHCSSLRALFLGRSYTLCCGIKKEMLVSNPEGMEFMLSNIGPSLRLFSLGGKDCDPQQDLIFMNLEKVKFDGEGLTRSLIKYCVKLKVLQLFGVSHRFSSATSYEKSLNYLQGKFTRLYADTYMPSGFARDWTCSPNEGTTIDIYE